MNKREIFKEMNPHTKSNYSSAIKHYERFSNKDIEELIKEADHEQYMAIPLQKRSIKKHLTEFRVYLLESDLSKRSVKQYYSKIKAYYRLNEIEIPDIAPIKYKIETNISYSDLPTKKDIRIAIEMSDQLMQSIILFIISSGCARAELLSLTVKDFINATQLYHNGGDIKDILNQLTDKEVVPTFYIKRLKTNKYYYTYITPEACEYLISYLKNRKTLHTEDKLFDISLNSLIYKFRNINDNNNWGFKGSSRYFSPHKLRKFHASNIGLTPEDVDELQGRGKKNVHDTYIKINPEKLKEKYIEAMHNVEIFTKRGKRKEEPIDEEFNITINIFINGKGIKL